MFATLLYNKYLIRELVTRDVKGRYVGSIIGVFWSVLNPFLQLALYTVVFSTVMKTRFGDDPSWESFALYLFAALLPWMALQEAIIRSSRSFIENAHLIKKLRFPLETLPFSVVFSSFVHQILGTIVFVLVLVAIQAFNARFFALILPLFAVQVVMAYGLAVTVACLNVFFRDIAQILGVLFMLMFWVTPIVYPKNKATGHFLTLLSCNPLTHMVEAYRFVFLGNPTPSTWGLLYWIAFSFGAYFIGQFVLSRSRHELVDLL